MNALEIKTRLKEKKIKQSELARRFKVGNPAIHYLVNRKFKSARLEKRLARILGVSVEELRRDGDEAA